MYEIAGDGHRVGQRVRAFYERYPFPAYEPSDSPESLRQKARESVFAQLLDRQIPYNARVLDAGCGTGQLAIFLSLAGRTTVGIDFSSPSLQAAARFAKRFGLRHAHMVQMDVFALGLKEESFDCVISTGVLHHTADASRAFAGLVRLAKPGGYVLIGLYNRYARIPSSIRRWLFKVFGRLSDDVLPRRRGAKRQIWFLDQYAHPHETRHTVDEVMRWFAANDVETLGLVPRLPPAPALTIDDRLFAPVSMGTRIERVLAQLAWMWTIGREGGLFMMIGRRRAA